MRISRSADCVIGSSSVAESESSSSVTVAVLTRLPVASAATVPVTRYVIVEPFGMSTVSAIGPADGPTVLPVAPPVAVEVNVAPVSSAGNVSDTDAAVTSDGPLLVTVMV